MSCSAMFLKILDQILRAALGLGLYTYCAWLFLYRKLTPSSALLAEIDLRCFFISLYNMHTLYVYCVRPSARFACEIATHRDRLLSGIKLRRENKLVVVTKLTNCSNGIEQQT